MFEKMLFNYEYIVLISLCYEYLYLYTLLDYNYKKENYVDVPAYFMVKGTRFLFSLIALVMLIISVGLIYYGYINYGFPSMFVYQMISFVFLGFIFNLILIHVLFGRLFYDVVFTILPLIAIGYGIYVFSY